MAAQTPHLSISRPALAVSKLLGSAVSSACNTETVSVSVSSSEAMLAKTLSPPQDLLLLQFEKACLGTAGGKDI